MQANLVSLILNLKQSQQGRIQTMLKYDSLKRFSLNNSKLM